LNLRLGLFDSGLGGITVLKKVVERHGDISCIYLGDTARLPYGEKKPEEIRLIAKEIIEWISSQDVSAILVACNTTNSLAIDIVQSFSNVPVLNLINSAAEMVSETRVGVLATSATASSCAYTKSINAVSPGTYVIEKACPAFVPMIENGKSSRESMKKFAIDYLQPLVSARVEAIILGCSHYPLIQPLLQELIPKGIRLIDPAIGLAHQLDRILGEPSSLFSETSIFSNTKFFVTSDPMRFASKTSPWLGIRPEVELVSLQPKACFF